MISNYRGFWLLFLLFLVSSCSVTSGSYESITGKHRIEAVAELMEPITSLSSNVRIEVSYLGNGIKGKGYLYYREGTLRVLLLSPLKSPIYDLIVHPDSSYLIDFENMGYIDLKDSGCISSNLLPEEFNLLLPMLFLDFPKERLKMVRAIYLDETGRVMGFDYRSKSSGMHRIVSVQYLDYQEVASRNVPKRIVIENSGNDIVIELTRDIRVDIPIKDKVFNLSRLKEYRDLCSEK